MLRKVEEMISDHPVDKLVDWHDALSAVHRDAARSGHSELVLLLGMAILSLEDRLSTESDDRPKAAIVPFSNNN